ncbi:MAG TPA: hypothetical protein DDY90_09215 [Clostridiales bacterium]|nr:hypothetical protein [Clostridiales bacterium]
MMKEEMTMQKRLVALLLVSVMTLGLLAGCSSAPKNPGSDNTATTAAEETAAALAGTGGTFRDPVTSDLDVMNPFIYTKESASYMLDLTGMTLYRMYANDEGTKYIRVPELAESNPEQMDEDRLVWQIKIRKDAKWANGDPVNANDVVYTLKMAWDPLLINKQSNQIADNYIQIKNAVAYSMQGSDNSVSWDDVGVKALDDYTLQLELAAPATEYDIIAHFANTWCTIVHPATFEACMSEDRTSCTYGSSLDSYMSCGRYIFTQWVPGALFRCEKNPDYVLPKYNKLDAIELRVVTDSNAALELYLNGEVDRVQLPDAAVDTYIDDPSLISMPANAVRMISVNSKNTNNNGILGNVNFRKALFYAMDRVSMAKVAYGTPANYVIPLKCVDDDGVQVRSREDAKSYLTKNNGYDPALAKEYYDKAMEECGLDKLTLTLLYSESDSTNKASSEFLTKSLPEIFGDSFTLQLQAQPGNVLSGIWKSARNGDDNAFELSWNSWNTSTVAPWNGMKIYLSDYANRSTNYSNPEYDALWQKANQDIEAKLNPELRMDLTLQMEQIALEDLPYIPVLERPIYYLVNPRVHTFSAQYVPAYGYGFYEGWVEE